MSEHRRLSSVASGPGVSATIAAEERPSSRPFDIPIGYLEHYGIQRLANAGSERSAGGQPSEDVHRAADRALSGGAAPLPHLDAIQQSFGRHDLSSVSAHLGPEASAGTNAMGAEAFATGNQVAFAASSPSLHTAAHEAAHVVQQRAGVHLKGGVGEVGDPYEQHADRVADAVVQGRSAEALLDVHAGDSGGLGIAGQGLAVQRQQAPGSAQPQSPPAQSRQAPQNPLIAELTTLLRDAQWPAIRARLYPQISGPAVQRGADRRAGTIPDLTGLGTITSLDHFAAALRQLQGHWSGLNTDGRASALFQAANQQLTAAHVPPLRHYHVQAMTPRGSFELGEWRLHLQQALLQGATLSDDGAADLCNTTLHESRHAEQAFLAARWAAGLGHTASRIASEVGVHASVAAIARRQPLTSTSPNAAERALGEQMFQSEVTDGATHGAQELDTQTQIDELGRRHTAAEHALTDLQANDSPATNQAARTACDALRAQVAAVETSYRAYRAIPHEADAHEVGDGAEAAFRRTP